jgi:hypothetical protein
MSFSNKFSELMSIRRLMAIAGIIGSLGGAGYKYAPAMWHKTASGTASHPAAKIAAANPPAVTNAVALNPGDLCLGEVVLTNHCETTVQLSNGKNCTLLARGDGRNVELTVALKSCMANGLTHDLSVTQVSAKSGKPLEVALGDYELSFTPKIEN